VRRTLVLCALLAGCGGDGQGVTVAIEGVPAASTAIECTVSAGGDEVLRRFDDPGVLARVVAAGATSFGVVVPAEAPLVLVSAQARAGDRLLAYGEATCESCTTVRIVLTPPESPDAGVPLDNGRD